MVFWVVVSVTQRRNPSTGLYCASDSVRKWTRGACKTGKSDGQDRMGSQPLKKPDVFMVLYSVYLQFSFRIPYYSHQSSSPLQ